MIHWFSTFLDPKKNIPNKSPRPWTPYGCDKLKADLRPGQLAERDLATLTLDPVVPTDPLEIGHVQ